MRGSDAGNVRVLVVAPSFPALNQPWINSHLKQLRREKIDFRVVSFSPIDSEQRRLAAGEFLDVTTFIEWTRDRVLRSALSQLLGNPIGELAFALRAFLVPGATSLTPKQRLKLVAYSLHIRRVLGLRSSEHVVHVHFDQDAFFFVPWCLDSKTPLVTTFHGLNPYGVPPIDRATRRVTYLGAGLVLANTEFAKGQAVALGCPADKVRVVPQGLEMSDFPFRPADAPTDLSRLNLLTVGRLQRDKGQVYAVLAAARLKKLGVNFHWTFVGAGPDFGRLNRLVHHFDLEGEVDILRHVDRRELDLLYRRSHIFVLPSTSNAFGHHIETQGVVLQEAQATGCIVAASSVGGIPECVQDGIDAIVFEERSSTAITRAIVRLLGDRANWPAMQRHARANVEARFSIDVIAPRIHEVYLESLARRD